MYNTASEVSPFFIRTKFGRNFMRMGFNNGDASTHDHHTDSSMNNRNSNNKDGAYSYGSYSPSYDGTDSEGRSRAHVGRSSKSPQAMQPSPYYNQTHSSRKKVPLSAKGTKLPQAILYDQRVLKSLHQQRKRYSQVEREALWNNRFHLDPMPEYDVTRDVHARVFTSSTIFRSSACRKSREAEDGTSVLLSTSFPDASKESPQQTRKRSSSATISRRLEQTKHKTSLPLVRNPVRSADRLTQQQQGRLSRGSLAMDHSFGSVQLSVVKNSIYLEMEELFEKLKVRIQKLWEDLRIPRNERNEFSMLYMNSPTKENIAIVTQEVQKLTEYRSNTILTLQHISEREALLDNLRQLVTTMHNRVLDLEQRTEVTKQVKGLLTMIRIATLEVVESVDRWRSKMNHQKPFMWQRQNYLLKILSDLGFFIESSLSELVSNTTNLYRNPFMMPGISFGLQSLDNANILKKKTLDKPDNSEVTTPRERLPPIKTPDSLIKPDPFKERIIRAQNILFQELENSILHAININKSQNRETLQDGNTLTLEQQTAPEHHRRVVDSTNNSNVNNYQSGEVVQTDSSLSHTPEQRTEPDTKRVNTPNAIHHSSSESQVQTPRDASEMAESVQILQANINSAILKSATRELQSKLDRAVISIQKVFKGYRTKKIIKLLKLQKEQELQEEIRREREEFERLKEEKFATRVQSVFRTRYAQCELKQETEDKTRVARLLQSKFRKDKEIEVSPTTPLQKELIDGDPHIRSRVIAIQKHWRKAIARKRFQKLHALHVQEMQKQNELEKREYMARVIQTQYRKYRAKKGVKVLVAKQQEEMRRLVEQERTALAAQFAELDDL